MELRVFEYRLPLVSPFVFGAFALRERRGWIVGLSDGELCGWGEAAPLAGFEGQSTASAGSELLRVEVTGAQRASELPGAWPANGFTLDGAQGLGSIASGAVQAAWCDLQARRAGVPLAQWLVPGAGEQVRCNATIGGGDVRLRRIRIAAAVRDGYTTLKLKTGGLSWCDELDLLEEIATQYPGVRVRLDPNGLWTVPEAQSRLRSLRDLPIDYVEQPVAADDVEGLLALADGPDGGRVAADEALLGEGVVSSRLLGPGGVSRVVLKPGALGGPLAALVLAARARAGGVTVTTMLDSALGRAMAAHVAAAVDARHGAGVHGLATGHLLARDLADWVDGPVVRLRGPGLGFEPEVSGLERLR